MIGRGTLAGYRRAEIACPRRVLRHAASSRLSYVCGCASEMDFPLSEFVGLQYRSGTEACFPGPAPSQERSACQLCSSSHVPQLDCGEKLV